MNEQQLNHFNQQLRANPEYQAYLRSLGVNPAGPIHLSDTQRKQAEYWVRQHVGDIGKLEIDPAGNANQNEGFGKQAMRYGPIIGGGALAAFGIPGLFPGLVGGSGGAGAGAAAGASGAASGTLPSASIAGLHAAVPGAIASQGVSAGIPFASSVLPSAAIGGLEAAVPGAIGSQGASQGAALGGLAPTAAAGGGSLASKFLNSLTDPKTLATLAATVPMIASAANGGSSDQFPDELRRMIAINEARMRRADPLHEAVTQMAFAGLPTYGRQGLSLPRVPLPG